MKITLSTDSVTEIKADILAVGVPSSLKSPLYKALSKAMKSLGSVVAKEEFKGRRGEVLKVHATGIEAHTLVLVGLGDGPDDGRLVGARAGQLSRAHGSIAVALTKVDADAVRAAGEGLELGAYRYTDYLTGPRKPKTELKRGVILVDKATAAFRKSAEQGRLVGEATNLARDLVNGPPNDMNPTALAKAAQSMSRKVGLKCTVWDKARIKKERMELFLAVNRGSSQPPKMIHMVHKPARPKARVVFVGKGLTFDAGGLCLKPAKSMLDMKCDMGGAATTVGILKAVAQLKLPVEVHGLVGSTENMLGADAYRPSDVFTSREGKTVEIINTDAEGRLVLADVLDYATSLKPNYLVTHATLTGAAMVALGKWRAAMYGNDADFASNYSLAAELAQEKFWPMPLDDDLRETMHSDIADVKHTGDPHGGSIIAALFLREFVGDCKWVHCDIAGPAFQDRTIGVHPKGGTGFGVATGVRFCEQVAGR